MQSFSVGLLFVINWGGDNAPDSKVPNLIYALRRVYFGGGGQSAPKAKYQFSLCFVIN